MTLIRECLELHTQPGTFQIIADKPNTPDHASPAVCGDGTS